ncbi:TetR family transcriptional regulator [Amaricoccus macauensis]|uniref:TetR/AcrR family transcriptional regulator n=1 Tax=Amaricoccus macauensis TaxID=57001 RepID=UPI003C7B8153
MRNPAELQPRRDAEATRAAILRAARESFSARGFEVAGLREIAASAGCNIALISRYFGSKEGLFRSVMEECLDLGALTEVADADLPAAIAEMALAKDGGASGFDAMIAAIRSSSSEAARRIVREELGEPMVAALAERLGGSDADTRAALVLSVVAGFDVSRHMICVDALDRTHDDRLRPRLQAAIAAILER